jgi:hypothetical protein
MKTQIKVTVILTILHYLLDQSIKKKHTPELLNIQTTPPSSPKAKDKMSSIKS